MKLDLNISLAKSYLVLLGARSKNTKHTEQIDNCFTQFNYLESWRNKAIKMINAKNQLLIQQEQENKLLESEISKLNIELSQLKGLSKDQQQQIDRLIDEKTKDF